MKLEWKIKMQLPNGIYITDAGSTLEISGKHSGVSGIYFDWFEEGACVECRVESYPEKYDEDDWRLIWSCEYCSGGNAKLKLMKCQ